MPNPRSIPIANDNIAGADMAVAEVHRPILRRIAQTGAAAVAVSISSNGRLAPVILCMARHRSREEEEAVNST
jgi:hypothetical protein